ncbi:Uncharacterized protein FWK35_00029747 [Aphis craccivora]|uniref:Uncharacterized protein n=1 Tax=Aphis craccivora TaxID=307492 RepID=A0A6G0VUD2_APHCR|nr:Uncharacterized protein FWK35_00029747 [Aphis craccivora]
MLSIHRDIEINVEEVLDEISQKLRRMDIILHHIRTIILLSGLLDSIGHIRFCNIIIYKELIDDAQKRILSTTLQNLAYQITSDFHQERTSTYFIPYIPYGPGLKRLAKVKLLDCLNLN